MRVDLEKVVTKNGAVTFLDILGWKGIWQKDKNAINKLHRLIMDITNRAQETTSVVGQEDGAPRGISTTVLSISDTIAIFTPGTPYYALKIHADICQLAVPESIKRGIPLRGATSYGQFSIKNNIMLGPAVDESASWHEATDWMGVILTPSAKFQLETDVPENWITYSNIPFKKGKFPHLDYCVDWKIEMNELYRLFADAGPHIPEIAPKYLNTLAFLEWRSKSNTK